MTTSICPNHNNRLLCLTLFAIFTLHTVSREIIAQTRTPGLVSEIKLEKMFAKSLFPERTFRLLGFTNQGDFAFLDRKNWRNNVGDIVLWSAGQQRAISVKPLSKWLSGSDLILSLDGKWFAANNDRSTRYFPHVQAYRTTVLRSSDFKIVKTRNLSDKTDSSGLLSIINDSQHIISVMSSLIPYENDFTYGHDRLEWLNLRTGQIDKVLKYQPAGETDKLVVSPDDKYLAGFFYSAPFNPYGESEYSPLRDKLERQGFIDIINPKTGKILWHIEPSNKQPVGEPLFFISPTRFISSDTVFNIATKTARPWNAITPTRKCLAAVPNHPNCALFLTPSGLQLRDWQKDKLLVSWPSIKEPGRIMFSPDLKMFSFKQGSLIQFWKFDSRWLK